MEASMRSHNQKQSALEALVRSQQLKISQQEQVWFLHSLFKCFGILYVGCIVLKTKMIRHGQEIERQRILHQQELQRATMKQQQEAARALKSRRPTASVEQPAVSKRLKGSSAAVSGSSSSSEIL